MFTLEVNYCNCHPATCCCDPWVIKKDGRKFVSVFDKENGEIIVKSLNKTEQKKKGK
jgi:hypothetical protein